jgi:tRNA(Ile)-lysidine synthase
VESIFNSLRDSLGRAETPQRWCVAFSGGLDSTVLTYALRELCAEFEQARLRAIHVNHGLHADAATWAAQCERVASALDVPLEVVEVVVDRDSGEGTEAAARRSRYAAFAASLAPGETLLTAHHADDQVETFLLRLLRGSGVRGLSSIAVRSPFGPGELLRPLLGVSRDELEAFGRARGLDWIEDPSNRDTGLDRNYLRHEVVPVLMRRWPGLRTAVGRSARLLGEAGTLLDEEAERDAALVMRGDLLDLEALSRLDASRRRNFVRYVLHSRGMLPPSEARLRAGLDQLLTARGDRQPAMVWSGGQIRRYRGRLYVLNNSFASECERVDLSEQFAWDVRAALDLGPLRGRLRFAVGADAPAIDANLSVRFRRGGERGLAADGAHHAKLKKIFQSRGVVPWMRAHVPLIFAGDELLAAGDLWSSEALSACVDPVNRLIWDRHPDIF